jgi:hypothetical protein
MKKALFFFLLFPSFLFAGSFDSLYFSIAHMTLKSSVFSPISLSNFPTVNLSVEHLLSDDVSLSGEFGYQFYTFVKGDTAFVRPSGYKIATQLRFYDFFPMRAKKHALYHKMMGPYFGIDFFYRYNKFNTALTYGNTNDTLRYHDSFWVEKKVYGGNFCIGYQNTFSKHFCFDISAGIGIMNRKIIDHNMEFGSVSGDTVAGSIFTGQNDAINSGPILSLKLGFNLCYIVY